MRKPQKNYCVYYKISAGLKYAGLPKRTAQTADFFLKAGVAVKKVTASAVTFAAVTFAVSHRLPIRDDLFIICGIFSLVNVRQ